MNYDARMSIDVPWHTYLGKKVKVSLERLTCPHMRSSCITPPVDATIDTPDEGAVLRLHTTAKNAEVRTLFWWSII